jgi:hypothetical protein
LLLSITPAMAVRGIAAEPPQGGDAKRVPRAQVIPLPYDQASFRCEGIELTRYHFGPTLRRPFWYPLAGAAGRSLTRMGHPHDPHTHSHHNSVWISHHDVGGVDFWGDRGKGRIVLRWVQQYDDSDAAASMLSRNAWQDDQGKTLLDEWRRVRVDSPGSPESGQWQMVVDLHLEAPAGTSITLGQTAFGPIGVRMAKTIGVNDGGGVIRNSQGQRNEAEAFRRPARWVDYSGPVTNELRGGITLMDHPGNPGHPTPFHVRNDGWMGASLTLDGPLTIEPGRPLRLRYALWVHDGVPQPSEINQRWKRFAAEPLSAVRPSD